jgi:shikimate 5-dehydrogenase
VNTLKFEKVMHPIRSTNTDLQGLIATKNKITELYPEIVKSHSQIIIWGGGGTLEVVKRVWPQAIAFSMRTGQPRDDLQKSWLPDNSKKLIVIWACGPTDAIPPSQIKPDLVIDLNYREDSMARELALQSKCIYVGGDIMFVAQAEAQMRFSLDK